MAKAIKPKLSKEERIINSLTTAARTLNKLVHRPSDNSDGPAADEIELREAVTLYQVFCPNEKKILTSPTTNEGAATRFRDKHNLVTDHDAQVLTSKKLV